MPVRDWSSPKNSSDIPIYGAEKRAEKSFENALNFYPELSDNSDRCNWVSQDEICKYGQEARVIHTEVRI